MNDLNPQSTLADFAGTSSEQMRSTVESQTTNSRPLRVLAVGQTPPPVHGQGIMLQMLLDGHMQDVNVKHVRMFFSSNISEVGKFQLGKILHLFSVIARIVYCRIKFGSQVLYYPPTGPNLVPLIRDIAILTLTRWMFSKTVFHFQANGVSELIARLPAPLRFLSMRALGRPDVAIELSRMGSDGAFLKAKRVVVIPNATYDTAASAQSVKPTRATQSPLKLLFVGTVCDGKGVFVLLDAVHEAVQRGCSLELNIVGGYYRAEVETEVRQRIAALGLESIVKLWGQQTGDNKWNRFAEADVFCFPTHYESEGFPCVILEAMCYSLPVISTHWRGIPAIIDDGVNGYLIEPRDHQQLADRLITLAQDPVLCSSLGHNGRRKYCQEYTAEQHIASMRDLFLSLR